MGESAGAATPTRVQGSSMSSQENLHSIVYLINPLSYTHVLFFRSQEIRFGPLSHLCTSVVIYCSDEACLSTLSLTWLQIVETVGIPLALNEWTEDLTCSNVT